MNTRQKRIKLIDFDEYLKEELKNPKFCSLYAEFGKQLEISYQILQMRRKAKMSQAALAKKIVDKIPQEKFRTVISLFLFLIGIRRVFFFFFACIYAHF